jgi:excisionase family DNA binding protein
MTAGKKYVRAGEIARLTGMSVRTVRRWIKNQVLPSIKLGGARLVATADLEHVLSPSHDTLQESWREEYAEDQTSDTYLGKHL